MNTLISADNTWVLWALIISSAAISIVLEQKYSWVAKVSGAIIALLFGLGMSNLRIIPTEAPVYDAVWGYVVPLAIPMLLFKADIRKIWRESGRMLKAFVFAAIGTSVGAFVATFLLKGAIPELGKIGGTMTASYIGGGVNFVAMTAVFKPSEYLVNSTIVADNLVMGAFFFVYMYIPASKFFRKRFKLSYPNLDNNVVINDEAENKAGAYWSRKEMSLKDIALTVAIAFGIACVSSVIGGFMGGVVPEGNFFFEMIKIILSNQYFLITIITVSLVALFPNFFDNLAGGQEIGTFLIYIFFVVIGIPASVMEIIVNSPLLFVFCIIIAAANLLSCLIGSKVTNITLEEAMLAANATVGGPTTAAAMAISKGWEEHIIPSLLCGLAGYVFGNFIALFVGNSLINLFG
jgi:uncharacterized membrane protein